jgi:hypothetical protein
MLHERFKLTWIVEVGIEANIDYLSKPLSYNPVMLKVIRLKAVLLNVVVSVWINTITCCFYVIYKCCDQTRIF